MHECFTTNVDVSKIECIACKRMVRIVIIWYYYSYLAVEVKSLARVLRYRYSIYIELDSILLAVARRVSHQSKIKTVIIGSENSATHINKMNIIQFW